MGMEKSQTQHTIDTLKSDWQAQILKDFRAAVIAELQDDQRDAMLRQVTDIAKTHGLII